MHLIPDFHDEELPRRAMRTPAQMALRFSVRAENWTMSKSQT